jgi:hypothetical protein
MYGNRQEANDTEILTLDLKNRAREIARKRGS